MKQEFIKNILLQLLLILVQIFICNHVMLFNIAVGFVFIYLIISMPVNMGTPALLTWAFLTGLTIDIFSDTPGVNALSCTLLAICKRPVLFAYITRDDRTKEIAPTMVALGFFTYAKYLLTMAAIYCSCVFLIEYFSFADIQEMFLLICSSTLLTALLLLGIDVVTNPRN